MMRDRIKVLKIYVKVGSFLQVLDSIKPRVQQVDNIKRRKSSANVSKDALHNKEEMHLSLNYFRFHNSDSLETADI
jgi:hypothetical protein